MLRLVPVPRPEGQDPPARRRKGIRSPSFSLTPDEAQRVRATVGNVARAYGGADVLASVLGVRVAYIHKAARPGSRPCGTLVIRLARAAGMTVEAILDGKLSSAGRCPTCGARAGGGAR